jgi:hypothetical protein
MAKRKESMNERAEKSQEEEAHKTTHKERGEEKAQ